MVDVMCGLEERDDLVIVIAASGELAHNLLHESLCRQTASTVLWLGTRSSSMQINHMWWVYNNNINTINNMTMNVNIKLTGGPTGPGRPFKPFEPYIEKMKHNTKKL